MPVIESKKRNSILGSLALLVGLSAIGLSAIDVGGLPSVNIGPWNLPFALALDLGVGALALVAFLLAAKSRRTGTELPVAALAVAVGATAIFYFRHRIPPAQLPTRPPPATAPAAQVRVPPPGAKPIARTSAPSMAMPSLATATSVAKNASQDAAAALARQQRLTELRDARARFAAAQAQVIQSLQSDPNYQNAKAVSDAADEQLRTARLQYSPGDSNLGAFSQTALNARDAMNQLIAQAVVKDPAASAAKAKLDALAQPD